MGLFSSKAKRASEASQKSQDKRKSQESRKSKDSRKSRDSKAGEEELELEKAASGQLPGSRGGSAHTAASWKGSTIDMVDEEQPPPVASSVGASGIESLDVVAPGEEDVPEGLRTESFERQVTRLASIQSTDATREKWGSKSQFLMSCIASAVGLGNVWRFPAVCAKYGGASFFIPYMVVLFVIARPLFFLELGLGQFSSKGSVRCWDLSPMFTGVGYAGSVSSVLLSSFYIMLMAWALIYSVLSFIGMVTGNLPWGEEAGKYFGGEVLRAVEFTSVDNADPNSYVPIPHLVLALLVSWLIIWGTMVRGVAASGKVAYVTALAPYVVLIILVGVGLCLEGMSLGLEYFIYPDLEKIIDPRTWYEAVGQCFFSLGIGFGGLIMFSSYNEFHHNIMSDVIVISVVDFVTSILAGISLMTILGFQATRTFGRMGYKEMQKLMGNCNDSHDELAELGYKNLAVDPYKSSMTELLGWESKTTPSAELLHILKTCQLKQLVKEGGAGIAFVEYPAAMYEIDQEWGNGIGGFLALIFFLMIILLAVGSANGFVGTTVTILSDRRPDWQRSHIVGGVCTMSFLIGLIYTNGLGSNWIDVVDTHGVTAVVYLLGFFEAIAVFAVYGMKNFCDDLEFLRNGRPMNWYFKICWICLPIFMLLVYISWIAMYVRPADWTAIITVVAWFITAFCLSVIPVVGIVKMLQYKKKPWRKNTGADASKPFIQAIWYPSSRWGPKDPEIRAAWKKFKADRPTSYNLLGKLNKLFGRRGRGPTTAAPSQATMTINNPAGDGKSQMESGVELATPMDSAAISTSPSSAPAV